MSSFLYGSSGDTRISLGSPTEDEISASHLGLGRKKATALIDAFLEAVYPTKVPFASGDVPKIIDSLTDDFAVYYIERDKAKGIGPLSDEIKAEYWDKPMEILRDIVTRKLELPELTAGLKKKVWASREGIPTIFDMDAIEKHALSSELIDEIEDERS